MPSFKYVAVNDQGQEVTGVLEAANMDKASGSLESQNLMPLNIEDNSDSKAKSSSSVSSVPTVAKKRKKVTDRDVIDFTRQMVTLLKAGVPILSSLETLAGQTENPAWSEVLIEVASDIAAGNDFSDSLGKHPKVFSELYVATVKAGEVGGVLDEVLSRIALMMQRDIEIRKSVKGAMRYPIMVVSMMIIAFLVLTAFVVPRFAGIFEQIGMDLPLPTLILIGLANFLKSFWWLVIIVLAGTITGFKIYTNTDQGEYWWDGFILKIPVFGQLVLKTAVTRFTKMFETLSRSELPILQIFEVVSRTIGNRVIGDALLKASEGIERGRGVSISLGETGLFPPLVIRMINVGEESGAIDDMLANISEYYDSEVQDSVDGMTGLIEPILTVGMGVMVTLFALAIFLPMWKMMEMAQQ